MPAEDIDGRKKKRPGLQEQTDIIVRAAVALFIQHGTRSVSIAQICSHADVSRPTFYRCFADKEALIASIYEHSVNRHVEHMLSCWQSHEHQHKQGLYPALDELLDAIFEQSQLAQLVFVESSDPASPASEIIEASFEHAADILAKVSNRQPMPQSRVYLKSIMAAMQWIVHNAIKQGLDDTSVKEAKHAAQQLVKNALST